MSALAPCAARLQLGGAAAIGRFPVPALGRSRALYKLNQARIVERRAGQRRGTRAAVVAQAQSATSAGTVPVTVTVPSCRLAFGEGLRLVGSTAQLGSWQLEQGVVLTWQEGDDWTADLALPPGEHRFKLVITKADGDTYWEEGGDRKLDVSQQPFTATCQFGDTNAMEVKAGAAGGAGGGVSAAAAALRDLANGVLPKTSGSAANRPPAPKGTSKAAQMLAEAVKAVQGQPSIAKEAEQLQVAMEAAVARVAELDRRKAALAAKLDTLQAEVETKLDLKVSDSRSRPASPPPPTRAAAAAAAAKVEAPKANPSWPSYSSTAGKATLKPPKPDMQQVQTGWLFRAKDADRAYGYSYNNRSSGPSRALVPLLMLPVLVPLCIGAYNAVATGYPELHLQPVPVKALADKARSSLTSTSGMSERLAALQKAGQKQLAAAQADKAGSSPTSTSGMSERLAALQKAGQKQLAAAQKAGAQQLAAAQKAGGQQLAAAQKASAESLAAAQKAAAQQQAAVQAAAKGAVDSAKQLQGPASK